MTVAQPRRGEEAVNEVGVSRADRLGVIQRIHRKGADVAFGPLEWLSPQPECLWLHLSLKARVI